MKIKYIFFHQGFRADTPSQLSMVVLSRRLFNLLLSKPLGPPKEALNTPTSGYPPLFGGRQRRAALPYFFRQRRKKRPGQALPRRRSGAWRAEAPSPPFGVSKEGLAAAEARL